MRANRRAQQVVAVSGVSHPVPDGFTHRFFQCPAARGHRAHLGTHQLYAEDVQRLAPDIFLSHVDNALKPQLGTNCGRSHPMLPGPGLGDDASLAHAVSEQALSQGVVDFMGAGVGQVFSFQENTGATGVLAQPFREIQGRRPARIVGGKCLKLSPEAGVGTGRPIGSRQLIQGRYQGLGNKAPTILPEITPFIRFQTLTSMTAPRAELIRPSWPFLPPAWLPSSPA